MLTPADLIETFNTVQKAHAASVHAPIVLTAVAAVVALVSAFFLGKSRSLRWATLVACAAVAASVWLAVRTGEAAYDQKGDPPEVVHDLAHEHEELAERLIPISYTCVILALGVWIPKRAVAGGAAWLTAGVAGAGALWAAFAGSLGGALVYDYGVGTPKPVTERDLAREVSGTWGDPRMDRYVRQVQPILSKYCFKCHGSGEDAENGLRLTTATGMLIGGDNGPAVVPGNPEGSLMYQAITGTHPDIFMPVGPRKLPEAELEILRAWIADGAVWVAPE